jgi:flagellar basal-body rod protein FlgG
MIRGIERLARDMTVRMLRQEKITGNLANSSTSGFKAERVFLSMLKTDLGDTRPLKQAEQQARSYTDFSQGPIDYTQRRLDVAIDGDGFFVVETPEGERFARSGNFTVNEQGFLAMQSGNLVLGSEGPIPMLGENVSITADGSVLVDNEEVGRFKIVTFSDCNTLVREGNLFAQTTEAYTDADLNKTRLIQGALERSNVNPIDEMVNMIALNRTFEAEQKSVRMQDDATKQLLDSAAGSSNK